MAKTKISEYSATPASNTDISNINIAEGCSPANVNNAIRSLMAQIKDLQAGTSGDTIPLTAGGTGSTTATDARTALSAAKSGANSDITSLTACTSITGITTPLTTAQGGTGTASTTFANLTTNVTGTLPVANGGTGSTTLTANSVVLGNGTSALSSNLVAPSTSGNILTSNGTTWTSAAAPSGITTTTGSAPYYGARAWVNFDGTNGTIRASGNVSSVTRNSTGNYTINFTTAMPDTNYSVSGWCGGSNITTGRSANISQMVTDSTFTTTALAVFTRDEGGTLDPNIVCVTIFR
jgi:hypothetical protein